MSTEIRNIETRYFSPKSRSREITILAKDPVFISQLNSGNEEALEKVFCEFAPQVYTYMYILTSGNIVEAEQLVSDVFIKLITKIKQNKGPTENVLGYLNKIGHSLYIDNFRLQSKTLSLEERVVLDRNEDYQNNIHKVERVADEFTRIEQLRRLKELVETSDISEVQKHIIKLRFWDGLKFTDIAKIIGKTPVTTKVNLNRALKKLKACGSVLELSDI